MKYSPEFYRSLKIGQNIYIINYSNKIEKFTIEEIRLTDKINKNGSNLYWACIVVKNDNENQKELDAHETIYLSEEEILFDLFGCSNKAVDILRLEKTLHSILAHPDYEYETTSGQRKVWDVNKPSGEGWEENTEHNGGFERFEYHEEAYWRRRKEIEEMVK